MNKNLKRLITLSSLIVLFVSCVYMFNGSSYSKKDYYVETKCFFNLNGGGYSIIYDTMGGDYLEPSSNCIACTTIPEGMPLKTPTRKGYMFIGWYYDKNYQNKVFGSRTKDVMARPIYDGDCIVGYNDVTLYARWQKNEINICPAGGSRVIIFNSMGGDSIPNGSVCIGCAPTAAAAIPTPTRNGYKFDGWYYESNYLTRVNGSLMSDIRANSSTDSDGCEVYAPTTVYAKWTKNQSTCNNPSGGGFTVRFDSKGGTAVNSVSVCVGCNPNTQPLLPTPSRSGYRFDGWYYDANYTSRVMGTSSSVINPSPIYKDGCIVGYNTITLFAKWVKTNSPTPGGPGNPSTPGESTCVDVPDTSYTLNFETNSNDKIADIDVCIGCASETYEKLPIPTRKNYVFEGWYYDKNFVRPIQGETLEAISPVPNITDEGCNIGYKDMTIYAKWTKMVKLMGTLVDSNGNALPYYNIEIHSDVVTTTTDAEGKFEVYVPKQEHDILVKDTTGLELVKDKVNLSNEETDTINYVLTINKVGNNYTLDISENTVKPNKTDEIEERTHNKEEKDNTFIIMVSVIVTITVMSIILVLVKSRSRQA